MRCGSARPSFGTLYLRDGEVLLPSRLSQCPAGLRRPSAAAGPYRPSTIGPPGRMLRTRSVVHIVDLTADPSYRERDPGVVAFVELAGTRTVLLVPMLKDGEPIGYLSIYRQEVRPSPTSRSSLSRILPPRPSSPSRTPACSTSCSALRSACSSRPRPPKCSRSSPARRASWSRCSRPCWRTRCASARPNSAVCSCTKAVHSARQHCSTCPPAYAEMRQREPIFGPGPKAPLSRVARTKQVVPHRRRHRTGLYRTRSDFRRHRRSSAARAPFLSFRCSRRTS